MGRPSITPAVAVDADGHLLLWIDGDLSGRQDLVQRVRLAASAGIPVPYTRQGPTVQASLDNPLGATAAMLTAIPGRTSVLSAPAVVVALFEAAGRREDV